ncbi:MAG: hypothetical protein GXO00_01245 [Candidatus Diapherotrites archaeon]|nr:hypothetical protein [Candidatus Diapherotrites archaeon]
MRSQGTFEYVLLLGGVILIVLLIINALIETAVSSTTEVSETVNIAYEKIQRALQEINVLA